MDQPVPPPIHRSWPSLWGALCAGILVALLTGTLAIPTVAAEDAELDDVLAGCDDEEDQELEEILEGFDEDDLEPAEAEDAPVSRFWRISGDFFLGGSYNLLSHRPPPGSAQYGGLSRLRVELALQLDLELPRSWRARIAGRGFYDSAYRIRGRSDYTRDVLDLYEWEAEFTEVYLQGSLLRDLDLKIGRQVVNWGTGETFRVVDVLNPLDNREPGLVDIEDLRQPVVMTKLDYYFGDWDLSLIAVHERRFNFFPPAVGLGLPDQEPAQTLANTEWAAALRGVFEGWDLGFFAARYYEDLPRVEFPGFELVRGALVPLPTQHSSLTLLGSTANVALGNWLLRGEVAYIDGLEYFHRPDRKTSRLDLLVGVDYSGFTDTFIAFDLVNRWIDGWESSFLDAPDFTRRNSLEVAFRVQRDFLQDTLHVTLLAVGFGRNLEDGSAVRLGVDYDLRDALSIGGGILLYQAGDLPPLSAYGRNDRVYLQTKYSF
jgi:hypothetical protein